MIRSPATQAAEPASTASLKGRNKSEKQLDTFVFAFKASAAAARERWSCMASATRFSCNAVSRGLREAASATSLGSDMCRTGVMLRRVGAETGRRTTGAVLGRSAAEASARFCASRAALSSRCCLHIRTCSRTRSRSSSAAAAAAAASGLPSDAATGAGAVEGRAMT
jgi:hypothetical protein